MENNKPKPGGSSPARDDDEWRQHLQVVNVTRWLDINRWAWTRECARSSTATWWTRRCTRSTRRSCRSTRWCTATLTRASSTPTTSRNWHNAAPAPERRVPPEPRKTYAIIIIFNHSSRDLQQSPTIDGLWSTLDENPALPYPPPSPTIPHHPSLASIWNDSNQLTTRKTNRRCQTRQIIIINRYSTAESDASALRVCYQHSTSVWRERKLGNCWTFHWVESWRRFAIINCGNFPFRFNQLKLIASDSIKHQQERAVPAASHPPGIQRQWHTNRRQFHSNIFCWCKLESTRGWISRDARW